MDQYLTREEILAAQDLPFEDVPVPEWGKDKKVRIVGLNSNAAIEFARRKTNNDIADLLTMTIVDEKSQPIFTNEDMDALGKKSAQVIDRLGRVALRLSGMGIKAKQDAKKN